MNIFTISTYVPIKVRVLMVKYYWLSYVAINNYLLLYYFLNNLSFKRTKSFL